jgi:hypothetical protein
MVQVAVVMVSKGVWFKHRDAAFYPAWCQGLVGARGRRAAAAAASGNAHATGPAWARWKVLSRPTQHPRPPPQQAMSLSQLPITLLEILVFGTITYWMIGFVAGGRGVGRRGQQVFQGWGC